MRRGLLICGVLLVCAAALAAATVSVAAAGGEGSKKAAKLAAALHGKLFSIREAVEVAEKATGGKAIASEVEVEKGKAVVEVIVLKFGDHPKLLEVELDGATNHINEVEAAEDEGRENGHGRDEDDEDEEDDD